MNLVKFFWPTAILNPEALQLNIAVGQRLLSFFKTRGVAPGYVENRPLAMNYNTSTSKLAGRIYAEVISGQRLVV